MKKALIALVLLLGLLGFWFYGRPAYRQYQENRAARQARSFMEKDYRNASLSARQALQRNAHNVEACRVSAELADLSHSPSALDWRRRVAEAEPTVQNRLVLASTAMWVQGPPYTLARQTLEDLGDSAKGVAAYQAAWGRLELNLKDVTAASARFEQASRLEPTNALYDLNLAVLQLESTNAALAAEARARLDRLAASPELGALALRWLVAASLAAHDLSGAERFSERLLAKAQAAPADRLQHLSILQESHSPTFTNYLAALRNSVLTNALETYGLAAWMNTHGMVDDALGWLTNCPVKLRSEQPVPLSIVDCYLARKDWPGLETFLLEQKWSDRECLRWAFLSRAASEQKQMLAAESRWRRAVRDAGDRLGALMSLLKMATAWGREDARDELLWHIAQRFPGERWALRELENRYVASGNTYQLNKVYSTMASLDSRNFVAQNNWAATCLLLKLNLPRAHALAKETFAQHPTDAVVASTYAYSLYLQGRTNDCLTVFQKLKPEALETPAVALYYGVLLSAAGDTNAASKYLQIAQKAGGLPEEKALVAAAIKRTRSGT